MAASSSSGNGGVAAAVPSPSESETPGARAAAIQRKLYNAYRQIVFLDRNIRDLKRLYKRAEGNSHSCAFRYHIRMKASIANGVKMMYVHYAKIKLAELERITRQRNAPNSLRRR
ncbi:uncharacterized protein [Dermacentor albipictus]|uniref:uncharacterized protein n=1 Tax=Dermacentor albipictus TaxID=60249 RepID=UPI0031FDA079